MNDEQSRHETGEEPAVPADEENSLPADEETGGLFPLPAGEAEEQPDVSAQGKPSGAAAGENWKVVFQETGAPKRDTQKEAALAKRLKRQQKAETQSEQKPGSQFSQRGRTQGTDAAVQKAKPVLPALIIGILLLLCIALGIMLFYTRSQMNDPNGTAEMNTSGSDVLDFPDDIAPATRAATVTTETTLTTSAHRTENVEDEPKKQTAKTENTSEQTGTGPAAGTDAPVQTQAPSAGVNNPPVYIPPVQTPAATRATTKTTAKTTAATTTATTTTQLIMTTTAAPVSANMILIADSIYAHAGDRQVAVNIWVRNNGGYANSTVRVVHTPGIVPCFDRFGDALITKGNTVSGAMSTTYSANAYTLSLATIGSDAVGADGTYATLYFDVPAGAAPGTVYYLAVYPDSIANGSAPIPCNGFGGAIIVY